MKRTMLAGLTLVLIAAALALAWSGGAVKEKRAVAVNAPLPAGAAARLGKGRIVSFAVSADGARLAVASMAGVYLYDAGSFDLLATWPWSAVDALSFRPDGRRLVGVQKTDANRRQLMEWEVDTGQIVHQWQLDGVLDSAEVRWPDGEHAVVLVEQYRRLCIPRYGQTGGECDSAPGEWNAQLVEMSSGLGRRVAFLQDYMSSMTLKPDGSEVAMSLDDRSLRWDATHDLELGRTEWGRVAYAPDGRTLAVGSLNVLHLWDLNSGEQRSLHDLRGQTWIEPAFRGDGALLAGSSDRSVVVWDFATGTVRGRWQCETDIHGLRWGNGETLFVWAGEQIEAWEVGSQRRLRVLTEHFGYQGQLAWAPDGDTLATATNLFQRGGTLLLWDVAGNLLKRFDDPRGIEGLSWAPDGEQLVVCSGGDQLLWVDAARWSERKRIKVEGGTVRSVAWSPDGGQIALGLNDRQVRVLDALSGEERWNASVLPEWRASLEFPQNPVISLAWSADGKRLAAGMWDGPVFVWQAASGEQSAVLEHTLTPYSYFNSARGLNWRTDGRLAAGFNSGLIWPAEPVAVVWDVRSRERVTALYGGGEYVSPALTPGGTLAAVCIGGKYGRLVMWNTADTRLARSGELPELALAGLNCSQPAWSPDGRRLAAVMEDGTVWLWNMGE